MYRFLGVLICVLVPSYAYAVLPPDIIFSVTSTLTQSLVAIGVILSGMWLSLTTFLRGNSLRFWFIQGCVYIPIIFS
jgi:hypothetical protein